jgi:hypothetical protein
MAVRFSMCECYLKPSKAEALLSMYPCMIEMKLTGEKATMEMDRIKYMSCDELGS